MANTSRAAGKPREITGRMVLIGIVVFFTIVITVNVMMARFAFSTFAGVETESSYKAGLLFAKERAAANRQIARHWQVDVTMQELGAGNRRVLVRATDAQGHPLSSLKADGRLAHPTDARKDVVLDLTPLGDGRYRADAVAGPGQWDLVIDFAQGDERVFRSKNRVQLP